MNESDRNNPRRLMRAIEIALSVIPAKAGIHDRVISYPTMDSGLRRNYTATMISLHAPLDYLEFQIKTRVHQMLSLGLESEVTDLLQTYSWNDPGLQTIGYYEWQPFFEGKIDREEVVNQIILHNRQYARKQQIYLKRYPNIQRFDISDPTQLDQCSQKCEEILNKT